MFPNGGNWHQERGGRLKRSPVVVTRPINGVFFRMRRYAYASTPPPPDITRTTYVGYVNAAFDLNAYHVTAGYITAAYDLNAYSLETGYLNGHYDLNTFAAATGYLNAHYDLNTFAAKTGYLNAHYDINAFTSATGYLNAAYDLNTYAVKTGYLNAAYDLNAYASKTGYLNAHYDLNTFRVAYGYVNASYDLMAFTAKTGYLNAHYDLNAFVSTKGFVTGSYDLNVYQEIRGYLNAAYDLLANEVFYGYAINLETGAVTKYEDFNFNSLSPRYGAKSDGIYRLGGTDDNGTRIDWSFKTGKMDFGSLQTRVSDAYLNINTDGDATLTVTADSGTTAYQVPKTGAMKNRKVDLAKGHRGRHWQVELKNKANTTATGELSSAELIVVEKGRRV